MDRSAIANLPVNYDCFQKGVEMRLRYIMVFGLMLIMMAGCGGGGSSTPSIEDNGNQNQGLTVKGSVIDNRIPYAQLTFSLYSGQVITTTIADENGNFSQFFEKNILPVEDFLIIEAINPENGLNIRSAVETSTLHSSISVYESNLTTISHYTEAALIYIEIEGGLTTDRYNHLLKNQINLRHDGTPLPTGNADVDLLALAIKYKFDDPNASTDDYRLAQYESILVRRLPVTLKYNEPPIEVPLPVRAEDNILVDVSAETGNATINDNVIILDQSGVNGGEFVSLDITLSLNNSSISRSFQSYVVPGDIQPAEKQPVEISLLNNIPEAARSRIKRVSTFFGSVAADSTQKMNTEIGVDRDFMQPVAAEDDNGNLVLLTFVPGGSSAVDLSVETTTRALVYISPVLMFRTPVERAELVRSVPSDDERFEKLMEKVGQHIQAGTPWADDEDVHILAAEIAKAYIALVPNNVLINSIYNPISDENNPPYLNIEGNNVIFKNSRLIYYAAQVIDLHLQTRLHRAAIPVEGRRGILDIIDGETSYGTLTPASSVNKNYLIYFSRGGFRTYDPLTASADLWGMRYNIAGGAIRSTSIIIGAKTGGVGGFAIQVLFDSLPMSTMMYHEANLTAALITGDIDEVVLAFVAAVKDLSPALLDTLSSIPVSAVFNSATNPGLMSSITGLSSKAFDAVVNLIVSGADTVAYCNQLLRSAQMASYLVSVSPKGEIIAVHALGEHSAEAGVNIIRDFFPANQPQGVTAAGNANGTLSVNWEPLASVYGYRIYDENFNLLSSSNFKLPAGSDGSTSFTTAYPVGSSAVYISSVTALGTESVPIRVVVSVAVPQYTVSVTAGTGGSVTPAYRIVDSGKTTMFTVVPNSGYTYGGVNSTCGSGSWFGNGYITAAITADCSVNFQFSHIGGADPDPDPGSYDYQIPISYVEIAADDLNALLSADGVSENFVGNFVHKVSVQAGGGLYTNTRMKLYLNRIPVDGYAKGVSDDSMVQRAQIGTDPDFSLPINGLGWVDVSAYVAGNELFMVLDSMWGTNKDTFIYFWFSTNDPITDAGFSLLDDYDDDLESISINSYKIVN